MEDFWVFMCIYICLILHFGIFSPFLSFLSLLGSYYFNFFLHSRGRGFVPFFPFLFFKIIYSSFSFRLIYFLSRTLSVIDIVLVSCIVMNNHFQIRLYDPVRKYTFFCNRPKVSGSVIPSNVSNAKFTLSRNGNGHEFFHFHQHIQYRQVRWRYTSNIGFSSAVPCTVSGSGG